jgi:hypothetical protein
MSQHLQRVRQGVDYGEEQNVQNLHASLRGLSDGRVTIKPFSLGMLVILGLIFFIGGFFSGRHGANSTVANVGALNSMPAPSTQAAQPSAATASAVQSPVENANAPAVVQVTIRNMKFDPPNVEVKKGDTVEWKNDDITPHTATSATFDSGSI